MLIVCEGKKTEPSYFDHFAREEDVRLVRIEIVPSAAVPKTVVRHAVDFKRAAEREAKKSRDASLRYDEVWCVFDVDEHPALAEALDQAAANGLRVALSNPCFELWFLLHFQE